MKNLLAALAIITIALCSSVSLNAQTYKPDWATKVVLAGNGTDVTNTLTLISPTQSAPITLTLPVGNPAGAGYILTSTVGGVMSWTNPATAVTLAGDIIGAAGANTIAATAAAGNNAVTAINLGTGIIKTANGGTGIATAPTPGSVVYGATATTQGYTAAGTLGMTLHSATAGTPTWSKIALGNTAEVSGILLPSNGGTGVANADANTLTLAQPVSFLGGFSTIIRSTAATDVTLPTSGTLLSQAVAFTTNGALFASGPSTITSTPAMTSGQLLIGGTGAPALGTLTGTANQVIVTNGNNSITLSLPQSIAAASTPTFGGLTLSNLTAQPGVVHNSAAGLLSSSAVVLTTEVSGILPIANGGTNGSATPTNGGVSYGTGTAYAFSAAGTTGMTLHSAGAASPTWSLLNLASATEVSGILSPVNGGTGVANLATSTLTLGGPVTFAGAFATTINVSAATNVTLPTTGTLLSSGAGFNTNGVIYASSATAITSTAAGTTGQVLTAVTAGAPVWAAPGSTITYSASTTNAFAGNTNNYAINANNTVYYLQNTTGGSVDLTGLVAATPGRLIILVNNSAVAADVIVLKDKNASSTSVNQFHLQGASDILLGVDGTVSMIYDATATNSAGATGAWRVIANY